MKTSSPSDSSGHRLRAALRFRSAAGGLLLVLPAFILMALLVFLPATRSLLRTVTDDAAGTLTLSRYEAFFADKWSVSNLVFTVWCSVVAGAILLIIGLGLALYLRFTRSRLSGLIQTIAIFPLFVPGLIVSFALIRFLGPTGVVATILKAIGIPGYQTPYLHPSGAIIGMVWEGIPLTVMLLTAGLAQIPQNSIEAARDVGAGRLRIFLHIILPQLTRTVVVVICLNFLGTFGAFTVPYILGPAAPQMMSVFMQRTFSELHQGGTAETQAAISFLVCLVIGGIYTVAVFHDRTNRKAVAP